MTGEQKPGGLSTPTDLAGLCERLKRLDTTWLASAGIAPPINPDGPEAAAAIERLVAALEPFARRADYFDAVWGEGGSDRAETSHPIGDFRRARTVLEGASDDR